MLELNEIVILRSVKTHQIVIIRIIFVSNEWHCHHSLNWLVLFHFWHKEKNYIQTETYARLIVPNVKNSLAYHLTLCWSLVILCKRPLNLCRSMSANPVNHNFSKLRIFPFITHTRTKMKWCYTFYFLHLLGNGLHFVRCCNTLIWWDIVRMVLFVRLKWQSQRIVTVNKEKRRKNKMRCMHITSWTTHFGSVRLRNSSFQSSSNEKNVVPSKRSKNHR